MRDMWKWIAAIVFMIVVAVASFGVATLLEVQKSPISDTLIVTGWQLVAVMLGAILGGSVSTIAGVVALLRTIRNDPKKMAAIEEFYGLQPVERKKAIRQGVELIKESA